MQQPAPDHTRHCLAHLQAEEGERPARAWGPRQPRPPCGHTEAPEPAPVLWQLCIPISGLERDASTLGLAASTPVLRAQAGPSTGHGRSCSPASALWHVCGLLCGTSWLGWALAAYVQEGDVRASTHLTHCREEVSFMSHVTRGAATGLCFYHVLIGPKDSDARSSLVGQDPTHGGSGYIAPRGLPK